VKSAIQMMALSAIDKGPGSLEATAPRHVGLSDGTAIWEKRRRACISLHPPSDFPSLRQRLSSTGCADASREKNILLPPCFIPSIPHCSFVSSDHLQPQKRRDLRCRRIKRSASSRLEAFQRLQVGVIHAAARCCSLHV
jgi:hypothetical protein